MTADDLVAKFCTRLKQLYHTCSDVAQEEGASFQEGVSSQIPFNKKLAVGEITASLPTVIMCKGNVQVQIQPKEICQDHHTGKHYADLSVHRVIVGQGHPTSPTCWTDLENPDDPAWYADPAWQKNTLVNRELIKTWLYSSGPPPIW